MKLVLNKLKDLFEANLKGVVKGVFLGDPILIPESYMPCLIIDPVKSEIDIADNARDFYTHQIDIKLVQNALTQIDKVPSEAVGTTYLVDTMEGEDSNGDLLSTSIVGILRDNMTVATNIFLENTLSVDYGINKRTSDFITIEGSVRIEIKRLRNRV